MPTPTVTTAELQARPFKRGEKVALVADVAEHPEGAVGKVAVANGLTWLRYWVRFPDGRIVGHVDHNDLVRAKDIDRFRFAREYEAEQAEVLAAQAAEAAEAAAASGDSGGGGDDADGGAVVNGVSIPPHLLERSKNARVRLGA